ncbi:DnaJ domain-containing protein [Quillaja saponaria]|uniref:DnaJ domain-containing protein n=1 Tax=Quillaja saponaria TaxID=32244 RepID=A0AAD7LCF8_QUISA|nr:DnaJ domain-containing protein [Quillaja saponaria]
MEKVGQEFADFKSQLVSEICYISTRSVSCVHRHVCRPVKSPFVDWYRILGVEENAGIDIIRKRYHKLALQLHPDKNKHSKAEIAFKLVSEAYTCLSDKAKREAFDLARRKNFCFECNRIPYTTGKEFENCNASRFKAWNRTNLSRSCKLWRSLKDIRERFREEAKVIENCLRSNTASRKESPLFNPSEYLLRSNSQPRFQKESPIFNPSDYFYQGYPHMRTQIYKKPEKFWYLQTGNIVNSGMASTAKYESPIFGVRSESRMFMSNSAYVNS